MLLLRRFSTALLTIIMFISWRPAISSAERLKYPQLPDRRVVNIDFEGPVFEDPGFRVKDHTLTRSGGVYHLFYIRGDETEFGHASSADLQHWDIYDPVLEAGPESWDSYRIWAPHVVQNPDYDVCFNMYYTGVNSNEAQVIYFATSSYDISNWVKAPYPVLQPFHADTSWIDWDRSRMSHFRDPFFFRGNGTDYLLATALTDDNLGAIALASGYGMLWEDEGPLYVHNNSNLLESSSLIRENGRYHLFFTESSVGGISHMSADSLIGEWDISTRSIIDAGHACELFNLGDGEYIFSRHTAYNTAAGKLYTIRFDTISFDTAIPEVRRNRILARDWNILWGDAFDNQPVYGNPYRYRGADTVDVGFEGKWWIGTYESFDGPIYGPYPGSIQGDTPRGAIRTDDFMVRGRSMRLLVGGGNKPDSCYVALCHSGSGEIIYSETGRNTNRMTERFWDLDPVWGEEVFLTIVDNASGEFGHINVDGIEERGRPLLPPPDSVRADQPGPKDIHPYGSEGTDPIGYPDSPPVAAGISNYPNPFNPATTITIRSTPGSEKEIRIYSATGRLIRSIAVRCGSDGAGRAEWDGKDRWGNLVSSGVYTASFTTEAGMAVSRKLVLLR